MYYEARIKQGRKIVFSCNVTSMDDALDWFIKFSYSSKKNYILSLKMKVLR